MPAESDAPGSIRVFLVDDHRVVRSGVSAYLAQVDGIEVIGEAGDGRQALDRIAVLEPGGNHWFGNQLGSWLAANSIPSAAITDGLIFVAVAMLLTRTAGLVIRAHAVSGSAPATIPSPDYTHV